MSEIFERLRLCSGVTEWLDPSDFRLVSATGERAPNKGGNVRESWFCEPSEQAMLASEIRRIIVPEIMHARVEVCFDGEEDWNRVLLHFANVEDWQRVAPRNSGIETGLGHAAWAVVGICEEVMGLALFAHDIGDRIEARIQAVPEHIFEQII